MVAIPRALPALSLRSRRAIAVAVGIVLIAGVLAYLHDPPWIGDVTAGLRAWETDEHGDRYRWTSGRATFYVPSTAKSMTLPLRPLPPISDRPITVDVAVDDRWLATLELPDTREPNPNVWVLHTLPLPRQTTSRRYRRVDLRIVRVLGLFNLGVQLGVVAAR